IEETDPPAGMRQRHLSDPKRLAGIGERSIAVVLVERIALVRKIRNHDVWPAVIIVVSEIYPHAGIRATVHIHRDPRCESDLFECAVSLVVIQKLRHRVICKKKIYMPVTVVVRDCNAKPLARFGQVHFLSDVGESSILIIVKNERSDWLEVIGMTIRP